MFDVEEWNKTGKLVPRDPEKWNRCKLFSQRQTCFHIGILGGLLTTTICVKLIPGRYLLHVSLLGGFIAMTARRVKYFNTCMESEDPNFGNIKESNLKISIQERKELLEPTEESNFIPDTTFEFDDPSSTKEHLDGGISDGIHESSISILGGAEKLQPKKSVTYDELRQKHREQYLIDLRKELEDRQSQKTQVHENTRIQEQVSQESESSEYPQYKRKNKYGDGIE